MKRSLRVPFSLLLLVAAFALLLSRSVLHRGFGSIPFHQPSNPHPNSTRLLALAAVDPAESDLKREVEDLIEGNLPHSGRSPRHRTISLWHHDNHVPLNPEIRLRPAATRYHTRLRPPRDSRVFPEFRRSLRNWIRNHHLHPHIISDLPSLIKRPIDLHVNRSAPAAARYTSCAVVGNSGILLKSDHADLIDGHEAVIRLNNARIQGYNRHVGSKTTISFINSNILHLCARRQGCFCHPYGEGVPIVMYICQPLHFVDYLTCNASHKSPLLITDARFDVLCGRVVKYYSMKRFIESTGKGPEEWSKAHDEKMFHYSSGMQAVVMAAGICDKVSVFGFGKSSEAKHHYHTNQKAELDLHDYEAEYAFYRDLMERPEVIPFINDGGFKAPPVVFYH